MPPLLPVADAVAAEPALRAGVAALAPGGDLGRSRRRSLLAAFAITQTVGYGVLYYAFSVFLAPIAVDLHTSTTVVTGALTLAVATTAMSAIPVGRWIDRRGGHGLMTAGSVLAVAAVAAWSQVHTVTGLYTVLAVIGFASALVLYEPAFAVVIQHFPAAVRSQALLTITIVAGFASSIFIPLAGLLTAHLGWRHAVLTLAALLLILTVPLHAYVIPRGRAPRPAPATGSHADGDTRTALADPGFWRLLMVFTAQGAATTAVGVHLVTYLVRLGHRPTTAAAIAGLLGVLSVTGRLVTTGLLRRHSIATITATIFLTQAIGIAALPALGTSTTGAAICVTLFGIGFGVATIARPALIADRYGTSSYATIAGTMTTPVTTIKATAPLLAALLAASAGYTTLMLTLAAACVAAATMLYTLPTRAGAGRRDGVGQQ